MNLRIKLWGRSKAEDGFSLDLRSADKELKAVTPEK